ncbi:MAG: hypothetical protein LBE34_15320 [Flavobacteriaceae bacterium]|nr:hypothetical protein [Flavobacteriaceae bacterium]
MKEPRLYVDFNELIDEDLILLSQSDYKTDSADNSIHLYNGKAVSIYEDDTDYTGNSDNLLAEGIVVPNPLPNHIVKWCCRINKKGIYHESEER